MRMIKSGVIGLGVVFAVAISTGAAPVAPTPAKAPAAPAANKQQQNQGPVVDAAKALLKEYQTVMKEKKGEGLREKCDYWGEKKPEGVTAESVLAVIEKPIPGAGDQRAEAYVKWQLLSGVTGKFPEELKQRALRAYQAAPDPRPSPGLNRMELERTLNRVGISKKDAEADINKEYGEVITRWRIEIEPILSYRDEFYNRLPPSYETYVAGLTDVYERVTRGAPANEFWTTVGNAIRTWALTASDTRQLAQMSGGVNKLLESVKDERNKPYSVVRWEHHDKFMGLKWHSEQTIREVKSIDDVATLLEERTQNPGAAGGLGFKGEDKEKEMKKK